MYQRIAIGVIAVAVVLLGGAAFAILHHEADIEKVRFSLQDQHGNTISEQNFRGQWLVVFFGFTNCPSVCPTQLMTISQALNQLSLVEQQELPVPVFITVDPERDTAGQMKRYLQGFHKNYIGLTGTSEQIRSAASSFKVFYRVSAADQGGATVDHTSVIYLVGPTGKIVSHYPLNVSASELTDEMRNTI